MVSVLLETGRCEAQLRRVKKEFILCFTMFCFWPFAFSGKCVPTVQKRPALLPSLGMRLIFKLQSLILVGMKNLKTHAYLNSNLASVLKKQCRKVFMSKNGNYMVTYDREKLD